MSNRPNVLFIYPDQMRYDVMSHVGNSLIETPAVDQLAEEGVAFTNAYTSYPLCCPFRGSIMTGKYAHKHGLYVNHYPIPLDQEFLPELMGANGYNTGWIGKWHLNGGRKQDFVPKEQRLGFDHFVGYSRGHSYLKSVFYDNDDCTPRKSKDYEAVYQTRQLFDFIDQSETSDKPFFAGICYSIPHPPFIAPESYLTMYDPADIPVNENTPADIEQEAREFTAKYYGLVKMMDDEIAKVIEGLEQRGLTDNTMIVFVSDHGEMAGEHGIFKKIVIKEASMHVPFIIRYPKKMKPGKIEGIVDPSVDVFATILDVCGINVPDYADGISLKEQLELKDDPISKDYVYFQNVRQPFTDVEISFPASRGIRTLEYCYAAIEGKPSELYDLKHDPMEQNNLVGKPEYEAIVKELHDKTLANMEELNDDWDICFDKSIDGYQNDIAAVEWGANLWDKAVFSD